MYMDLDYQLIHDVPTFADNCASGWLDRSRDPECEPGVSETYLAHFHSIMHALSLYRAACIAHEDERSQYTRKRLGLAYEELVVCVGKECEPFYLDWIDV